MFNKPFFSASLIAVFLLTLFISQNTAAQTVTGTVVDIQTKEPLAGAAIRQAGTSRGSSAEADGSFSLKLSDAGERGLLITYVGYKDKEVKLGADITDLVIYMEPDTYISSEVFVQATRVDEATPFTYSNLTKEELEKKNLGQDVPYLLNSSPSVVTTSDAGAGVGYTGIRIRGVDPARVNVTINGIPVNDAESHGVYWVDLPDIASSAENIQIQRGVGTSTNGAGAFGGSINLQTGSNNVEQFAEVNTGIGSFNTQKANIMLGTGLMKNGWMFEGRLSKITSDGYIDRATSDLNSFYLEGSKRGKRSLLQANVFSGKEITYQAWNGVPEPILENDAAELENYIGDAWLPDDQADFWRANLGNHQFNQFTYQNQVDNYRQDYYQLHYSYQFTENLTANASLHYTKGEGYYEEYKVGQELAEYGITSSEAYADLVRRRWLDNDFYGAIFSAKYSPNEDLNITLGGGYNEYKGGHFGEVIWAQFAGDSQPGDRYYDNDATKKDLNFYSKFQYFVNDNISAFLDLQGRVINYEFVGFAYAGNNELVSIDQTDDLFFFNPKFGAVYTIDPTSRIFASLSVASKEPTRDEYVNSTEQSRPNAETLYDIEVGYHKEFAKAYVGVNLYDMIYKDQLILTGEVNDVGEYIRQNVDNSYRMGIELEGGIQLMPELAWSANAAFSKNKIEKFSNYLTDYDNGGQVVTEYENTDIAFSPNVVANSIFTYTQKGVVTEFSSKYVGKQFLDNTQNDTRSIDAYLIHTLQFSYTYDKLNFLQGITGTLQINNLLDKEYVANGYTYGYIYGSEQHYNYYYPQAGRHFMFQVTWNF